jgi:tetratricopeptide (TPR) repeat protein
MDLKLTSVLLSHSIAIKYYDNALDIARNNVYVLVLRAGILDRLGSYAEAMTSVDKALAMSATYTFALYQNL